MYIVFNMYKGNKKRVRNAHIKSFYVVDENQIK